MAFLNSNRANLLAGVGGDGAALGLDEVRFENKSKMLLYLINTIKSLPGTKANQFLNLGIPAS